MFKEVMKDLWLARISSLSNEVGLYVVQLDIKWITSSLSIWLITPSPFLYHWNVKTPKGGIQKPQIEDGHTINTLEVTKKKRANSNPQTILQKTKDWTRTPLKTEHELHTNHRIYLLELFLRPNTLMKNDNKLVLNVYCKMYFTIFVIVIIRYLKFVYYDIFTSFFVL